MDKRLDEIKLGLSNAFNITYFLHLTDYLTELVTKEMGLLKLVKIDEVEILQPKKQAGCELYANIIRYLRENPEQLNNLSGQERAVLKDVTENLSRLLDRNERMVKGFNEANKRMMEIFHEVVQSRLTSQYGPQGRKRPPQAGYSNFSQSG